MTRSLLAAAASLLLATSAHAAKIWTDLSVDGKTHFIHVEGKLVDGDGQQFANVVRQAEVAPDTATVHLDSPGGRVTAGIEIGRAIRKNRWNTYVGPGRTCSSMCANIWLAGRTRYVTTTSHIGFHSLSNSNSPQQRDESANARFMAYYRDVGISMKAARVFEAAEPGNDAIWLDAGLAKALGISMTVTTLDERVKGEAASSSILSARPAFPRPPSSQPEPTPKPDYWLPRNVAWPLRDEPNEVTIDPRLLQNTPMVAHPVQTVVVGPVKLPAPKPVRPELPMDADAKRAAKPAEAKRPDSGLTAIQIGCMKQYGAYADPRYNNRLIIHGGLDLQQKVDAVHFCVAQKTGKPSSFLRPMQPKS